MSAVGIIFSNIHDKNIAELTRMRTMASVPFGCRYRLIDFTLSNMVNSGITHVGVITHYNYQSLMDHIGSGKDWDLARRGGGVQILPPYITAFSNSANFLYNTRLEALKSINSFISNCKEDYVILSDCDVICNLDLSALLEEHIRSGADATFIVKRSYLTKEMKAPTVVMESNEDGRLIGVEEYSGNKSGYADVSLNIWVTQRRFLEDIVLDATAHGYDDFTNDVIKRNLSAYTFKVYPCSDYFAAIHSLAHKLDDFDGKPAEPEAQYGGKPQSVDYFDPFGTVDSAHSAVQSNGGAGNAGDQSVAFAGWYSKPPGRGCPDHNGE